jgi:hypothetical protein
MPMAIETLAATAITLLSPYLAAGAKKAAEVAGAAVADQAGKLLSKIRDWFGSDQEAKAALQNYEINPNRYGPTVQDILLEKLKANPNWADELRQIVDAMGPRIDVFQNVKKLAGQATGLDIAKWEKGMATAIQEVNVVEPGASLTGAIVRDSK